MKDTLILAIESSCDETAASVVKNGRTIIVQCVSHHRSHFIHYMEEWYRRLHPESILKQINQVIEQALDRGRSVLWMIWTAIGVTYGPGLGGCIAGGRCRGQGHCIRRRNCHLVGVHHIEGHVSANYIEHPDLEPPFCVP